MRCSALTFALSAVHAAALIRASSSQGELAVAGVYVRVFNQQPNFPLADPAAFCKVSVVLLSACKPGLRPSRAHGSLQLASAVTTC